MEAVDVESGASEPSSRSLVVAFAIGFAIIVVALLVRRSRRRIAEVAEAGVVGLADAVIDELLAG